jgi:cell division protein FtsA
VDGLKGIRNPVGLNAESVEVEANVVIGEAAPLKNVTRAVEAVGVHPRALVAGALASAEAVLTEDEREMGVVMVDVGGGTSDIAVFQGGNLLHTSVIPVGGHQITRDIGYALHVPFFFAEELKIKHGNAMLEGVEETQIEIPKFQGGVKRTVSSKELNQPIHERIKELVRMIAIQINQSGLKRFPPGGLVLTGGASVLPGIGGIVDEMFGIPVRVGSPRNIAGLPAELRTPAYATTVGILLWGIKHEGEGRSYSDNGERTLFGRGLFRRRRQSDAVAK